MQAIESSFYDTDYFHTMENRYWMRAHAERIRDLMSYFPSGKTVLDYGAGSGFLAYQAAIRQNQVTAWDYSESARQFIRDHYGDHVTVVDQPQGTFDFLFLFDVIEHIAPEEQPGFVQVLKGYLQKNGSCLVSTDNQDSWFLQSSFGRLLQKIDKRLTASGRVQRLVRGAEYPRPYQKKYHDSHIGLLGRDALVKLFEANGFRLRSEKHGFLYVSPLSTLVSRLFAKRPLHSIYFFELV